MILSSDFFFILVSYFEFLRIARYDNEDICYDTDTEKGQADMTFTFIKPFLR
ncbi:MAG TPA: hypothetical protein VKY57_16510 [Chitinispirillaceae bacterium]|nr:hypothetical protein [Chitinispirillaceae bacterium]